MKLSRILAVNIVALTMFTPRIFAQADGCRGAVSALNRVKEQITPQLSTATPAGKDRLEVMFSTLKTASTACSDMAEIWHYRQVVAKRLGNVKETTFAQGRLEKLQYEEQFDPFTPPPAALPPPPGLQIASDKVRKKWALVVGIDEFKDPTLHQLRYAVKDSTDFDNFLTDPQRGRFPAQQVKHLVNQQATLKGIREGLGWLRVNVQPEDMVRKSCHTVGCAPSLWSYAGCTRRAKNHPLRHATGVVLFRTGSGATPGHCRELAHLAQHAHPLHPVQLAHIGHQLCNELVLRQFADVVFDRMSSGQQVANAHPKSSGQPLQRAQRWASLFIFYLRYIRAGYAHAQR